MLSVFSHVPPVVVAASAVVLVLCSMSLAPCAIESSDMFRQQRDVMDGGRPASLLQTERTINEPVGSLQLSKKGKGHRSRSSARPPRLPLPPLPHTIYATNPTLL